MKENGVSGISIFRASRINRLAFLFNRKLRQHALFLYI